MKTLNSLKVSTLCLFFLFVSTGSVLSQSTIKTRDNETHYFQTREGANGVHETYYSNESDSLCQVEKSVIVQFYGQTLADVNKLNTDKASKSLMLRQARDKQDEIFSQFEDELKQIGKTGFNFQNKSHSYIMKAKPGKKYKITYFGQQLTLDSMMIPEIEALPYVKAVHPDRKVKKKLTKQRIPN